jgi:hypothetical protein
LGTYITFPDSYFAHFVWIVKLSGKSIGLACCELFAEEDICTWEGQNEMRLEKKAKLGAS